MWWSRGTGNGGSGAGTIEFYAKSLGVGSGSSVVLSAVGGVASNGGAGGGGSVRGGYCSLTGASPTIVVAGGTSSTGSNGSAGSASFAALSGSPYCD